MMELSQIIEIAKQILEGLGLIVAGATIFARLTKTKTDDSVLEKIRFFLEKLGNLFLTDQKEISTGNRAPKEM